MSNAPHRRWIPELTGYRALAALAVFFFHLVSIRAPGGILGQATVPLGSAAVALFFALSGMLVYQPFARWALLGVPAVSTWRFVARRVARILPVYWVVLTFHLFVANAGDDRTWTGVLSAYTLTQNFDRHHIFLPPFVAWSLCVELWFSVTLPFLAAPIRRLGQRFHLNDRVTIQLAGIAVGGAASVLFRLLAFETEGSEYTVWPFAYFDWFGAGMVLAVMTEYWTVRTPGRNTRQLAAHPWFFWSLGLLCYWAITQLGLPGGFIAPTPFQGHSQFALQAAMSALLLAAVVLPGAATGWLGRFLSSRLLVWLGGLSYAIYLSHPVVTDLLIEHWPEMSLWTLAPIAVALTLVASTLLHRFIERPASAIVDRSLGQPGISLLAPRPRRSGDSDTAAALAAERAASEQAHLAVITSLTRPRTQNLVLVVLALASSLLSLPGRYVADSRYELSAAPFARLARMATGWDLERGLGRAAEEFWPGLTASSSLFHLLGAPPWLLQRLVHAMLLAIAGTGVLALSRLLRPGASWHGLAAALLFQFGPASSIYLLPAPLYVSYAIAPWLVVFVLRASRTTRPAPFAAATALVLFAAGNADPPGLVLAVVPAAVAFVAVAWRRREARAPLARYAGATLALVTLTSAAMMVKTMNGAAALSHRLTETESVAAVAASSSFAESIRGYGFWLAYFRLGPTAFRDHLSPFVENGWLVVASVLPLAIGLIGLARRVTAGGMLALAWCVIGIVVMVGPYPLDDPTLWGRALLRAFDASPTAFAFRSSHKAGLILALGSSLLGGWAAVDALGWARGFYDDGVGDERRHPMWVASIGGSIAVIAVAISSPFWTSPLYDAASSSDGVPRYWPEAEAWFDANEDSVGRVLVVPGTTNNGYRWGSVGDDLVDVLIPNPVVASTLPLSTPLAANLIDAIDTAVTSPSYRPGTLQPLAERFGITHVVVRNDLAWETQGVARPSLLAPLRADPALRPAASFGVPGLYVNSLTDPQPSELALAPVEIFAIADAARPEPVVVPMGDAPRQILVDGLGQTTIELAALGLLDGGHPLRFAAAQDTSLLNDVALAGDVALVVSSAVDPALDRRISYYGYEYARPGLGEGQPELRYGVAPDERLTVRAVDGGQVTSTVDRWLAGLDRSPALAIDSNPVTAWTVPRLVEDAIHRWTLTLDASTAARTELALSAIDPDGRISSMRILADGELVDYGRSRESGSEMLTVTAELPPFRELAVEFDPPHPGFAAYGLADVSFSSPDVTGLRIVDRAPTAPDGLSAVASQAPAALLLLTGGTPSATPRTVDLAPAKPGRYTIGGTVLTNAASYRCLRSVVSIDGQPVPVSVTPVGGGIASLGPCAGEPTVELDAAPHRFTLTPRPGDAIGSVYFTSGALGPDLAMAPVERRPLSSENEALANGDLLILPVAADDGWRLADSGSGAEAAVRVTLDGLSGFSIGNGGQLGGAASHKTQGRLNVGLGASALGLAGCGSILIAGRRRAPLTVATPAEPLEPMGRGLKLALAIAVAVGALIFAGSAGAIGAVAGLAIARFRQREAGWLLLIAGFVIAAAILYGAWPLIDGTADLIDPARADQPIRATVGLLIAWLGVATFGRFDDTVPRRELS